MCQIKCGRNHGCITKNRGGYGFLGAKTGKTSIFSAFEKLFLLNAVFAKQLLSAVVAVAKKNKIDNYINITLKPRS